MCQRQTLGFKGFFSFNPQNSLDWYGPYIPVSGKLKQKEVIPCPRLPNSKWQNRNRFQVCLMVKPISLNFAANLLSVVYGHTCLKRKSWHWCKAKIIHFIKKKAFESVPIQRVPFFIKTLEMNGRKIRRQCSILSSDVGYIISGYYSKFCHHNLSLLLSGLQFPDLLKWGWRWRRGGMFSIDFSGHKFLWHTTSVSVIICISLVCSDVLLRGESGGHRHRL